MTTLITKQPSEAYYISFDFTQALGTETVESATVTAIDYGTSEDNTSTVTDSTKQTETSTTVLVWIQAGTAGNKYLITCRVTGSSGSQYELDALLTVAESELDLSAYCQIEGLYNQISESDLVALSDDDDTGNINQSVIAQAIADADAEINAYLYGKYTIPLDPVPAIITKISVDLTIYRLSGRRGLPIADDRKAHYEESIRLLRDIQKGIATIGADLPSQSTDSGPVSTTSADNRIFKMSTMTNY
jgi:phage gp36-like protein